jgi:hypothetical protein
MGFIFRRVCSTLHTLNFSNKYSHVILGFYDCLLLKMSFHHNFLVFFHLIITMLDFVFVCLRFIMKYSERHEATCNLVVLFNHIIIIIDDDFSLY